MGGPADGVASATGAETTAHVVGPVVGTGMEAQPAPATTLPTKAGGAQAADRRMASATPQSSAQAAALTAEAREAAAAQARTASDGAALQVGPETGAGTGTAAIAQRPPAGTTTAAAAAETQLATADAGSAAAAETGGRGTTVVGVDDTDCTVCVLAARGPPHWADRSTAQPWAFVRALACGKPGASQSHGGTKRGDHSCALKAGSTGPGTAPRSP
jgi:hypothetical protein